MTMLLLTVVSLVSVHTLPPSTAAPASEERSGQSILKMCANYDGGDLENADLATLKAAVPCISYVAGLADAISHYEAWLRTTRMFDQMVHLKMLASVGALPKGVAERLSTGSDPSFAKFGSSLVQLQAAGATACPDATKRLGEGFTLSMFESQVCIPDGVRHTGQLALIIVKYVRDHPEKLHEDRAVLAFEALALAFPCPRQ